MDASGADVTTLLNRLADGDQEAAAQLVPLIYEELRRLATHRLRHERPGHTLQATALVHEVYLKLSVHESLSRLEKLDFRQARIVELRYFGGLTMDETAEVLRVSPRTVTREWNIAKAWLYGELKERPWR